MENQINVGDRNTQQIGQNPINQPPPIPEKPKVNYWIILTVIFAFLFIAVLISMAFFLRDKMTDTSLKDTSGSQTPPTISQEPTVSSPTIPKKEWETYSNSVYGISFKFPSDWSAENDSQTYQTWDQTINIFSSKETKEMPEVVGQIWIWKQNVGGKVISLQEFLNKPPQGGFQEYTKNGYTIYKAVEDKDKKRDITLVFEKSSRVFQIAFTISKNNHFEENTLLVNEIINSLSLN